MGPHGISIFQWGPMGDPCKALTHITWQIYKLVLDGASSFKNKSKNISTITNITFPQKTFLKKGNSKVTIQKTLIPKNENKSSLIPE
jgi:hypothetical protein